MQIKIIESIGKINKLLNFIFISIIILGIQSCGDDFDPKKDSIIEGKLTNSNREWLVLSEIELEKLVKVDSVRIETDGSFKLQFTNKHKAGFYLLQLGDFENKMTLLIEAGERLFVEASAINLSENYSVKNSPGSELLKLLYQKSDASMLRADSLYMAYRNTTLEGDAKAQYRILIDSLLRQTHLKHYEMVKNYCLTNKNSMAAILGLYSRFGQNQVLDFTIDFDVFQQVSKALQTKYNNNIHVVDLVKRVKEIEDAQQMESKLETAVEKGNFFPDILLQNPDNQPINLTSFKGKNLLIFLWKASDKNCWDLNKSLKEIYKKYNITKNLEIFAISFDSDKMLWSSTTKADKLIWQHGIADNKTTTQIPYKKIPRLILLDTEGKIVFNDTDILQLDEYLKTLNR